MCGKTKLFLLYFNRLLVLNSIVKIRVFGNKEPQRVAYTLLYTLTPQMKYIYLILHRNIPRLLRNTNIYLTLRSIYDFSVYQPSFICLSKGGICPKKYIYPSKICCRVFQLAKCQYPNK